MSQQLSSSDLKTRRFYYVLSTHWDREWYEPFQYYRHRLVNLMDQVLDGLEDGRLKGPFQTDGQAIILDDYLEIRPERRAQIEQFARDGRLSIGPWYVLPDEFLISGESHIRNLRLGRQIARNYGGKPSQAGFVCDLFGHISQLPQIMAGFAIEGCFTWRGINLDDKHHFLWTGADGTETVAYKFTHFGYSDYAFRVRHAHRQQEPFDADETRQRLDNYLQQEAAETEISAVLLFDGGDHCEWDQDVYSVLKEAMSASEGEPEIVHSDLDAYIQAMLEQRDSITERREGELREPGKTPMDSSHQIPGVLSSRVWIKQQNARCQALLCHWAEPFSAIAARQLPLTHPQGFLDVAWKHLIQNHPHDSICGCSVDRVHEDMKFRFSQAEQIGERLANDATRRITASVGEPVGEDEIRIGFFNPLPQEYDGPVEADLEIPAEWPGFQEFFGFERKPAFKIYDPAGKEIPYQRVGQRQNQNGARTYWTRFPEHYQYHRVRVCLRALIPAMGYTTFSVKPGEENHPTRYPEDKGLAVAHNAMENAHLRVEFAPNGTFSLLNKATGEQFEGLNTYENRADIGDGWYHGVAVNDRFHTGHGAQADIALHEDGPLMTSFRVRTTLELPAEFDFHTMERSEKRVPLVLDSIIRLREGARHVEVTTRVHNTLKDQRIRAIFPTHCGAGHYFTDTPFDVIRRPVGVRLDNHEFMELEVETRPQQSFTAVQSSDGERGLAVVATGLMESCVRDMDDSPIALTLYRSTRRTVMTNGEPDGQLLHHDLVFEYAVTPFDGEDDFPRLFALGQLLGAKLRSAQLRRPDMAIYRSGEGLPAAAGNLALEGPAVITSARDVDGAFEVRLFNPLTRSIRPKLHLRGALAGLKTATPVDLESNPAGEPETITDGALSVTLAAKKIITLRLA